MRNPNYELDSARFMLKYLTSRSNLLHMQALERIVKKFNCGSISAEEADKRINAIHTIRMKYEDIKSVQYTPTSMDQLEKLYLEFS